MRRSGAGCAFGSFSGGTEGNPPRPAPRQRPGPAFGLVLLGDPPPFDEDDANPHCCVKPERCSCRAVACGDRGVSCDMGRRPLVRRRRHRGSPSPARQGMPPPAPRPPRSPRQFGPRSRTLLGPVVPREPSGGLARLPHCRVRMSLTAVPVTAWHIRPDSPLPPGMRRHGASVPTGASPHAIRDTWHRGSRGTSASAAASYGCRARAGLPPAVCRPVCRAVSSRQRGRRATSGRRQNTPGTKPAPRRECLAALPPLAAMPIWRPVTTEKSRGAATPASRRWTACEKSRSDGATGRDAPPDGGATSIARFPPPRPLSRLQRNRRFDAQSEPDPPPDRASQSPRFRKRGPSIERATVASVTALVVALRGPAGRPRTGRSPRRDPAPRLDDNHCLVSGVRAPVPPGHPWPKHRFRPRTPGSAGTVLPPRSRRVPVVAGCPLRHPPHLPYVPTSGPEPSPTDQR